MSDTGKKVVALVGMPGAGKSICVEYLESKGVSSVYFGGVTVDEVKARGLEVNEKNEKMIREELRRTEGLGVMAKRMIEKIETLFKTGELRVVADGLYSWTEYKLFQDHFGSNVTIIAIVAPRHVRHARLANRPIRPLNDAEVTSREYAEIENLEKGGPIANADYTIVNNKSQDELLSELDQILTDIKFL